MAPEQIAGSANQDRRTDFYSFGVVLHEMAYGQLPFSGRNASEFFQHHLKTEPKVPHGPFADIVRRCLAKAPSMRYARVSDLLVDFERVCSDRKLFLPPRPVPEDNSLAELRARARSLGALGRHAEAIASARETVRRAPEDPAAWTGLGRRLLENGDKDGAKNATNPGACARSHRVRFLEQSRAYTGGEEKWHEAVEAFDRALDCDPQNTGAMMNAGKPLKKIGKFGEAVLRLRRASKIAPDSWGVWTNLAALYMESRDRAGALECYHKARSFAPANRRAEIEECIRGAEALPEGASPLALMTDGRIDDAKVLLQRAVKQNPDNRTAWHNLGICHLEAREHRDARECFAQVYRIDAKDGLAVCRLIELAAVAGDLEDAERWCDVLKLLPDGQASAIAFKARALAQCNRYQEATTLILDAVRKYPNEPDIWITCGDLMMFHPKAETAMLNATRAINEPLKS